MSDYRESSNLAKAKRLGIVDAKVTGKGKKKPKVRGPWKVMWSWRDGKPSVRYHCESEEMANKMLAKVGHYSMSKHWIEYQGETK